MEGQEEVRAAGLGEERGEGRVEEGEAIKEEAWQSLAAAEFAKDVMREVEEWEAEVALVVIAPAVMVIGLMEGLREVEEWGEAGVLAEITTHGELPKGAAERGEE